MPACLECRATRHGKFAGHFERAPLTERFAGLFLLKYAKVKTLKGDRSSIMMLSSCDANQASVPAQAGLERPQTFPNKESNTFRYYSSLIMLKLAS